MKALKCTAIDRAIGMMTDSTVVRIEALYGTGYLEFTMLVVYNTQYGSATHYCVYAASLSNA